MKLDPEMKHEIAMDKIEMTYSWYNISVGYNNNKVGYKSDKLSEWQSITFVDGMYSYDDINDYIH